MARDPAEQPNLSGMRPVPPPAAPPTPPGVPVYPPSPNPYLRSPIPSDQVLQPDTLRHFYQRGVSQYRIIPLPTAAKATINSTVKGVAKTVAQQVIASTPSSGGTVTSVGLTMPGIFTNPVAGSPITSSGVFAVGLAPQFQNTVFAGPPGTQGTLALDTSTFAVTPEANGTNSLTVHGVTLQANDFALLAASVIASNSSSTSGPDASWTQLFGMPSITGGAGIWWKNVPSAGAISGSVSITSSLTTIVMGEMVTVRTAGGTPTVRQSHSSTAVALNSGQTTTVAFTSNTLAGSTIFLVAALATTGGSAPFTVTDSQGNQYTQVATVSAKYSSGVVESLVIYASATSTAAADTLTIQNVSGIGQTCSFYILEVTALAPPVQTPIFRTLVPADIPGMQQGVMDLVHGGTQANLSTTGGTHQFLRQNSSGGAITVVQPDFSDLAGALNALPTSFDGATLVSKGLPSIVAQANLTGQSAAIAATTIYTTPGFSAGGPGQYRITWSAKVTTAATTSSTLGGTTGLQITFTDNDDSVVVVTPAWWGGGNNGSAPTSASLNTTQAWVGGEFTVNSGPIAAIKYAFGYASSGATAMQYNLHLRLEAL